MKDTRYIEWAATAQGYRVELSNHLGLIEEYEAGNSVYDSQVYVEPGTIGSVPLKTMRRYAKQTAQEMAQEYGVRLIGENSDLLET